MLTYQEDLLLSVYRREHQNSDDQARYDAHRALLSEGYYRKILDTTTHKRASDGRPAYTPLLSSRGEAEVKRVLAERGEE
jgi:hypothetical protein